MAETITAKIQVRRGELDDLPVLDEGEFGYALDFHRLFIGNAPSIFTADGVSTRFNISDRALIPGQMTVLVDGVEQIVGVDYQTVDTDIVFAEPPVAGTEVKVSHNTEISIVNQRATREYRVLQNNIADADTGINWSLANYNTANIDYSLKSTDGSMAVGTLKIITNGTDVSITDLGGVIGYTGVVFGSRIADNRLHITYTNSTTNQANFFFNIQLWNTI